MKAKVKKTGEIVEVYERYDALNMETVYEESSISYRPDELDFSNVPIITGWIARNKNNSLYLFKYHPSYNSLREHFNDDLFNFDCFSIPSELFPQVTFDNSPIEVEIQLKEI